jgi:hypothetical protein
MIYLCLGIEGSPCVLKWVRLMSGGHSQYVALDSTTRPWLLILKILSHHCPLFHTLS